MRVANAAALRDPPDDRPLLALCHAIASRNLSDVERRLDSSPDLATRLIQIGASRHDADGYFLDAIRHYVYRGDTALHVAAAAHQLAVAASLVARSGVVRARNRRGAEPLHYAADASPGTKWWDPGAQRDVIRFLIHHGADPNALDASGVAPLHRAVRTRSSTGLECR